MFKLFRVDTENAYPAVLNGWFHQVAAKDEQDAIDFVWDTYINWAKDDDDINKREEIKWIVEDVTEQFLNPKKKRPGFATRQSLQNSLLDILGKNIRCVVYFEGTIVPKFVMGTTGD